MSPVPSFPLSQSSLQDFADCERRFQLRYLLRVAWPAPQAEPQLENERRMKQGVRFHRLVHQRMLGIPPEKLETMHMEPPLDRWWRAHSRTFLPLLETFGEAPRRYPEITLLGRMGESRLIARYDLLLVQPGERALIVDWKTGRRPRRPRMAQRIQTRLYPFLLAQAGAFLNEGQPWEAEQIEMYYWFAEAPSEPMRFPYSAAKREDDRRYLNALLERIAALPTETLRPPAEDERACRYCVYRSLCARGITAAPFAEQEDEAAPEESPAWEVDFDAIEPVAF